VQNASPKARFQRAWRSEEAAKEKGKEPALAFGDLADPDSEVRELLHSHFSIRRKPELGTNPNVYYIV
jgi:molybdopterin-containing oxidoreductase family iron-sulfur binding subunit